VKEMVKRKSASTGGKKIGKKKPLKETSEASAKMVEEDISVLRDRLKEKETEAAEYLNTLQRLQADFENFKKRMLKEQTEFLEVASKNLILELIPVVDNLERALRASKEAKDSTSLSKGVEMVYAQLMDILKKAGVSEINPHGEEFNPFHHEAVMHVNSNKHADNTIVEVLQKGYLLKGRLLQPASVKVSKKNS